jgi:hypothetical protein
MSVQNAAAAAGCQCRILVGLTMAVRRTLLLRIETARVRHAWAKAQLTQSRSASALAKYVEESLNELQDLRSMVRQRRRLKK